MSKTNRATVKQQLQPITQHTAYLPGASNIGVITTTTGDAIAIDTGGSTESARTLCIALQHAGLTLRAVINTHHHGDHIGGNAHIVRTYPDIVIYAPPIEATFIAHPILQPIYFNCGATPPRVLRNRWIMAEAAPVHQLLGTPTHIEQTTPFPVTIAGVTIEVVPLPGHTIAHVGIAYDGVCFAADSYFSEAVLAKYGIPYAHDVAAQRASLERVAQRTDAWYVPSHGECIALAARDDILAHNRTAIMRATEYVYDALPGDLTTIVQRVKVAYGKTNMSINNAMFVPLQAVFTSVVAAHISFLEQQGRVHITASEQSIYWVER